MIFLQALRGDDLVINKDEYHAHSKSGEAQ